LIRASAPRGRGGSPDKQLRFKGLRGYSNSWNNYLKKAIYGDEEIDFSLLESQRYWLVIDIFKVEKDKGEKVRESPYTRIVFATGRTAKKVIKKYLKKGYAILYRGIYYIPRNVWEDYKRNYKKVKKEPQKAFEIFKLDRLTKVGDAIIGDFDDTKEEDIKRLIKYLHVLGIYPEVWRSASGKGYHLYIHLVWGIKKEVYTINGKRKEYISYELPYANDWRLQAIIEALKEICIRLGIKYDSISANRGVWLEGVPNPLKGWRASEKIFDGKVHRVDKLYEKIKPILEQKEKGRLARKFKREFIEGRVRKEIEIKAGSGVIFNAVGSSNPIDYIQANLENGNINRLLNAGYSLEEVGEILGESYEGDRKAFERAWRGAEAYIEANHIPLSEKLNKEKREKKKRERKEKHYWEYIPEIAKCLREGITGIRAISRKTGIPRSSISDIFKMVSREQILEGEEEVINYLKTIQKGGKRASEEKLKEGGKKRFRQYLESELRKIEEKYKEKKEKEKRAKTKIIEERKAFIGKYFVKLDLELPAYVEKLWKKADGYCDEGSNGGKVFEVGGCPNRALIYYSLEENGRGVDGKNCLVNSLSEKNLWKCKVVSDNNTDEISTQNREKGDGKGKKSLELSIIDIQKEKEHKKKEKTERLIKSRQIYAETWKTFKVVKNYLENKGIKVVDSRHEVSDTGLDGRKILKLIRYLLANGVKKLNLAGWGRYAEPLKGALLEAGLTDERTKMIMPEPKDAEELELEVLERLGFSREEVLEYQGLSEEGKLEYLERKGKLKEYRYLMTKYGIRKEELEMKEEWVGKEERNPDEEIIF